MQVLYHTKSCSSTAIQVGSQLTTVRWGHFDHSLGADEGCGGLRKDALMRVSVRVFLRLFQLRRSLRRSVSIQTITPAAATCC